MIPSGLLQVPYAGLFAILSLVAVVRLVRVHTWPARLTGAFELAMSVAMFVMVFNWGVSRAVTLHVVVFVCGALWYFARAFGLDERLVVPDVHTHGPLHLGYHALLMLTMVWMVVSMIPHGRPVTGHFSMIGMGQPVAFVAGMVLSGVQTLGTIVLLVRLIRGRHPRLSALYDVGMSAGMLAMTAPMINW